MARVAVPGSSRNGGRVFGVRLIEEGEASAITGAASGAMAMVGSASGLVSAPGATSGAADGAMVIAGAAAGTVGLPAIAGAASGAMVISGSGAGSVVNGPVFTVLPSISGLFRIGSTLSVATGAATGSGSISYSVQWTREGGPITSETLTNYLLDPSDDETLIGCLVTATDANGSTTVAATGAAIALWPTPVAAGALPDVTYTEDTGIATVNAAPDFTGAQGGAWSVTGAGATINTAGVVSIPTDTALAGVVVTVTYTNSGGADSSAFQVTVEPLNIAPFGVSPEILVEATGITLPQTYAMTPVVDQTGSVLVVHAGAITSISANANGVPMALIRSQGITTTSSGLVQSNAYIFYSEEVTGSIQISAGSAYTGTLVATLLRLTGGTVRSWRSFGQDIVPVGSGGFTVSQAVSYLDNDLAVSIPLGDFGRTVTPSTFTRHNDWNLASNVIQGDVHTRPYPTAGSGTISWNSQGFRLRLGTILAMLSQFPAPLISMAEAPAPDYVYPLDTATRTAAQVPVSGLYANASGAIEARVVTDAGVEVVPWATLVASPSGGTFSGSISVPKRSERMRVQCRFASDPALVFAQTTLWHTGIHVIAYGQSNTINWFAGSSFSSSGAFYNAGTGNFPAFGGGAQSFMEEMAADYTLPVLVIGGGAAGTGVDFLENPTNSANIALMNAIDTIGGPIHAILWHQGENEGNSGIAVDVSNYATKLNSIRSQIAAVTGQTASTIPLLVHSLATRGATGAALDISWTAIDDCHKQLPSLLTNCHWSGSDKDAARADGFHYYGEGYTRRGRRQAHHLGFVFGLEAASARFDIASATATSATVTTVTVDHGIGTAMQIIGMQHGVTGTLTTGLTSVPTAFQVWNGSAWVTATGTIVDGTTISLAHASIPTTGRRIRYLYGTNPGSDGLIRDNSTLNMPLTHVSDLACV